MTDAAKKEGEEFEFRFRIYDYNDDGSRFLKAEFPIPPFLFAFSTSLSAARVNHIKKMTAYVSPGVQVKDQEGTETIGRLDNSFLLQHINHMIAFSEHYQTPENVPINFLSPTYRMNITEQAIDSMSNAADYEGMLDMAKYYSHDTFAKFCAWRLVLAEVIEQMGKMTIDNAPMGSGDLVEDKPDPDSNVSVSEHNSAKRVITRKE